MHVTRLAAVALRDSSSPFIKEHQGHRFVLIEQKIRPEAKERPKGAFFKCLCRPA